jgi:hypothetical protein
VSGVLAHTPARVLAQVLIDLGLASNPEAATPGPWPVYAGKEPDEPDDAVTIYDTAGRDQGRVNPDSARLELYGVQVRVRSAVKQDGYVQSWVIAAALDAIYWWTVVVEAESYLLRNVVRAGPPAVLGTDSPQTERWLCTTNFLLSLARQPAAPGP